MQAACRECRKSVNKTWYYERGGHRRQPERRVVDRGKLLRYYAKKRAAAKALPYDLDEHKVEVERRVMAGRCELSGVAFDYDASQGFFSPSIDRKIPSEGYVLSNVRIIAFGLNVAINKWGEETLKTAMRSWFEHESKR